MVLQFYDDKIFQINTKCQSVKGALPRAAIVVTTSTWCSLDTWIAGNEESHTLYPFKEKGAWFQVAQTRLSKSQLSVSQPIRGRNARHSVKLGALCPTREIFYRHHSTLLPPTPTTIACFITTRQPQITSPQWPFTLYNTGPPSHQPPLRKPAGAMAQREEQEASR